MAGLALRGLLLGVLALQSADGLDPAELVTRLGAPRYADREAAGEALVKLGSAALPALVKARESRDPEVRQRAEVLAARIEAGAVLEATRVHLELRDRSLAEAVDAIGRESGMVLSPDAAGPRISLPRPPWPARRVTLEAAGPLPFWEAIDQLCKAGGLQRRYPPAGDVVNPFVPPFELVLVSGAARPPAVDVGALRVELLRVRHDRELDYGDDEPNFAPVRRRMDRTSDPKTGATVNASYRAELFVSAEPRLRIFGVGEVVEAEAVDDRGRSLVRGPTAEQEEIWRQNPHIDPRLHPALRYGSSYGTSLKSWAVSLPLKYPSPPPRRIARLSGAVPLVVLARRPDPLVVDLNGAVGKVFAAGATRITVHEVTVRPGEEPKVDLTLEAAPEDSRETITVCDTKGVRLAVNRPGDLLNLRLEILDERGGPLFWQFTRAPTERTQGRMAITVPRPITQLERLESLRLRYWELTAAATDLAFSFTDVPTP